MKDKIFLMQYSNQCRNNIAQWTVHLASHTSLACANKKTPLTGLTKVSKQHLGDPKFQHSWEQSQVQHHGVSKVKQEQRRSLLYTKSHRKLGLPLTASVFIGKVRGFLACLLSSTEYCKHVKTVYCHFCWLFQQNTKTL